jgi:hypothetical protein
MNQIAMPRENLARGPDGVVLSIADLPSPDTKRWVMRRKAVIAAAVRGGLISLEEAANRYRLHPQELMSWHYYIDRYGFSALRTTKIQTYVRPGQHKAPSPKRSAKTFDVARGSSSTPARNGLAKAPRRTPRVGASEEQLGISAWAATVRRW